MKKNDGNNGKQKEKSATGRLLLNKQTIRNLLTADQLKGVHGGVGSDGDGGDDGASSRNNHSGH